MSVPSHGNVLVGKRILVVDDEPLVLNITSQFLQMEGAVVLRALGGAEGLHLFHPQQFDLVITDGVMPDLNGDAVAAAVKARDKSMPVLLITGTAGANAVSSHFDAFLHKPFTMRELITAVTYLLSRSQKKGAMNETSLER